MRGLFNTLFTKLFLLISRGRLIQIDNDDTQVQKIQISNLADETISDIERYQEYGFENYPPIPNSEAVTLFISGNRNSNKGLNIVINNRKLRPIDLQSGEVCTYSIDSENGNTNRITIRPGQGEATDEIELETKDGNNIKINSQGINITDKNDNIILMNSSGTKLTDKNNNVYEMKSTGTKLTDKNGAIIETKNTGIDILDSLGNTLKLNGTTVDINGATKKFVTYTEFNTALTLFLVALNAHTHTETGGVTSTPITPMTFDVSAAESIKARLG